MKRIATALAVCLISLALVSCTQQPSGAPVGSPGQASSTTTDPSGGPAYKIDKSSPVITNTSARYYLQTYTLTDDTHENSQVSIRFPQLISSKSDGVNEVIRDYAASLAGQSGGYPENYTNLTLTVDYHLTYNSDDWLSVSFNGSGNVAGTPYPNDIMRTLNLDLKDGSALQLGDIYEINEGFARVFRAEFAKQVVERTGAITGASSGQTNSIATYLDKYDDPALIRSLNDSPCYMTSDKIGISFELSHVFGDHFETEIPYSDLSANLKITAPPFK